MPTFRQKLLSRLIRSSDVPGILAARSRTSAGYMRNEASPFLQTWRPILRDWNEDVRQAWYLATSRTIDLLQNSGWLSGGVQRATHAIMGAGLRLNSTPDAEVLDMTADEAQTLGRQIEARWDAYARNPMECDAHGRQTIAQMTATAVRCWFATGEILALLPSISRPGSTSRSKVRLLSPHRLRQEMTQLFNHIISGVGMDPNGMPIAYYLRLRGRESLDVWQTVAARDDVGRPQVIHVFDGNVGQVRGITPFAPAINTARQFDQLANATLVAALVQSIFAATIESNAPTNDLLQAFSNPQEQGVGGSVKDYLTARQGWYEGASVDIGQHGKMAHLFMGEKLSFQRSEHPNDNYEAFARMLLREVASCLGVTYEQLSGDYTGATYSSVRMSIAEVWPITVYRRENIAGAFLNPIYSVWLEEQIEQGLIVVPGGLDGFLSNRPAYTLCTWRGPPKPQADDIKTANAHKIWRDMGVITDEQICSDLGGDWDRVYEQRAREQEKRTELGLPEPPVGPAGGGGGGGFPPGEDPNAPEPADAPPDKVPA